VSTMVDDGGRAGCACRRWSTTAGARGARAPRAESTMVDDGGRMRAHEMSAVSTMVDDGGRERRRRRARAGRHERFTA
jgi:hypothetical protein